MNLCKIFQMFVLMLIYFCDQHRVFSTSETSEDNTELSSSSWGVDTSEGQWSLGERIPMTSEFDLLTEEEGRGRKKMKRIKKRLEKFLLPLLLAYKLKFFTLIPVMIGGLLLLTGATGLAGFFFALFAAVMGLKHHDH
ncbi:hypothetical protein WA026_008502 [Henosepilachna vigintioctopunctata]|uniref:Uncharacterized protein n=1 Tax=Henosepilachna vigintioctopunctata TaxID=420089 RepID=A0AAW1UKR1_9CUCU